MFLILWMLLASVAPDVEELSLSVEVYPATHLLGVPPGGPFVWGRVDALGVAQVLAPAVSGECLRVPGVAYAQYRLCAASACDGRRCDPSLCSGEAKAGTGSCTATYGVP